MNKKNRIILLAAMIVAAVSQTFAQGNGLAGINEATSMVTSYFDPGTAVSIPAKSAPMTHWKRTSILHWH